MRVSSLPLNHSLSQDSHPSPGQSSPPSGPFDTPSASITPTPTSSNNASTSKHSGLTAYNTTTRTPVSATLSAVVNPSQTGAAVKRGRVDKGVVLAGAGIVGAMMLEL